MSDFGDRHDPAELDSSKSATAISVLKGILYRLGGGITIGNSGPPLEIVSPTISTATACSGQITIAAAGTAANGPNVSNASGFYLQAHPDNASTNICWVGNDGAGDVTSSNGFPLTPTNGKMIVSVTNLNALWFDADENGGKICWHRA